MSKKILVLSEAYEGGEWIAVKRLVKAAEDYDKSRLNFSLIALGQPQEINSRVAGEQIFIPFSSARKPFSFIKNLFIDIMSIRRELIDYMSKNIPDSIIVTNFLTATALTGLGTKNIKYLYYFSGIRTPKVNFFKLSYRQMIVKVLEFFSLVKITIILVPAKEGEQIVRKILGIWGKRKKYFIIPNYVPKVFLKRLPKKVAHIKSPVILYSGRIARFKGLENLIDAFTMFLKDKPDSTLWLAYPSSNIDQEVFEILKQKVSKNRLNNSIKFIPDSATKQLIKLYRKANILVLPSEIEIAPLSILESLASGTPAVGTDAGNIKKVLSKIDKNLLLKDNHVDTTVEKLKYFFSLSPQRIRMLSKKSIAVAKKYSEEKTAEAFLLAINYSKTK